MKNLYVFFDTVSGNYGEVFQADNDLVMRRSAFNSLASFPPEIARDTVVLHLATISSDADGLPSICPCVPVRTALSGSSPEVQEIRAKLLAEAQRYFSFAGVADNEE